MRQSSLSSQKYNRRTENIFHQPLTPYMVKDHFFTQARFDPKLFYLEKCLNFDKSEFATKQRKIYLKTSISKTRLPHIYRGKNELCN